MWRWVAVLVCGASLLIIYYRGGSDTHSPGSYTDLEETKKSEKESSSSGEGTYPTSKKTVAYPNQLKHEGNPGAERVLSKNEKALMDTIKGFEVELEEARKELHDLHETIKAPETKDKYKKAKTNFFESEAAAEVLFKDVQEVLETLAAASTEQVHETVIGKSKEVLELLRAIKHEREGVRFLIAFTELEQETNKDPK